MKDVDAPAFGGELFFQESLCFTELGEQEHLSVEVIMEQLGELLYEHTCLRVNPYVVERLYGLVK